MTSAAPQSMRRVGILPLGEVPLPVLKALSAHTRSSFHLGAVVLPPRPSPPEAFNVSLQQYDAAKIIRAMDDMPVPGCEKVIAVLQGDLFIPIFSHVLGEAVQGGRHGVISLHRLTEADPAAAHTTVSIERAAKVALHELGHLYGLLHCTEPACLMRFSGGVNELDRLPLTLCTYCEIYLQDALKRGHQV